MPGAASGGIIGRAMRHRSSARLLAPLALLAALIALVVVVTGSGSSGSSGSSKSASPTIKAGGPASRRVARPTPKRKPAGKRSYTVQDGDTLSRIATKTGVSLATLQELNPSVDPQGLHTGDKLRIK